LEKAEKQVEHELALIQKLGFAGYFLIVWDLVDFCKKTTSWCKAGGVRRIPLSAMRLKLPRSIRWVWICSLNAS
jgi:hypothetical protein